MRFGLVTLSLLEPEQQPARVFLLLTAQNRPSLPLISFAFVPSPRWILDTFSTSSEHQIIGGKLTFTPPEALSLA